MYNTASVTPEQESTLIMKWSPALNETVQPVRVESSYFSALDNVGFALAVMVSATVGGKFAYVSFHTSRTKEPLGEPTNVTLVMVPDTGARPRILSPAGIADPPPDIVTVI